MVRSLAVFGMAFAGICVLAGPGWGLLAGAGLVLVLWRGGGLDMAVYAGAVRARLSRLAARVKAAPRRAGAMSGMGAGIALVPAGFGLVAGLGAALIASAVVLAGAGLLLGWNA